MPVVPTWVVFGMPAGGPYVLGQYNSSLFTAWEAPDPGFWVPNGYVVVKAAARGTSGASEESVRATCGNAVERSARSRSP